jgi:predicted Zn-dependent peptidase
VALGMWVSAGSRDERQRIAGASHFLEHLLFKGTPSRTAPQIAEAFDAVGGDLNAFSAREHTCFYARVLDRDLPMAVEYLCDMLQHSLLRPADFEAERQVILEEIHMHEDTPDDLIHDLFSETLWAAHPLGRPVLGTVDTITAVRRDQVRRFYKRHYVPANLVVAAAGSLRHDRLVELIESSLPTGKVRAEGPPGWRLRMAGGAPPPSGRRSIRRRPTEQAHIVVGTSGVSRSDPDRFAIGAVNHALGGGMSSRLFQEIREKRGLAYAVYSYHAMYAETGVFAAYAGATPGRAQEVLGLVRGQIEDVASSGITPAELDLAKGHLKGSLVLSQDDPGGRMNRLGKAEVGHGEVLTIDQVLDRIDAVNIEDARRAAARVLSRPMSLAVIGPFEPDAFEDPAEADAAVAAHHE